MSRRLYLAVRAAARLAFLTALAAIGFLVVAGAYELVTTAAAHFDRIIAH